MQTTFIAVAALNLAAVILSLLLNLNAFDAAEELCDSLFGDHALLLATVSALVLTTPWHKSTQLGKRTDRLVVTAVPLALLLTYAACIVIALNGEAYLDRGECPSASGRRGAYTSIVWLSLFCFLHTTLICFAMRYQNS